MYLITIFTVLLILKLSEVADLPTWVVTSPLITLALIFIVDFFLYFWLLASEGRTIKSKRLIQNNLNKKFEGE